MDARGPARAPRGFLPAAGDPGLAHGGGAAGDVPDDGPHARPGRPAQAAFPGAHDRVGRASFAAEGIPCEGAGSGRGSRAPAPPGEGDGGYRVPPHPRAPGASHVHRRSRVRRACPDGQEGHADGRPRPAHGGPFERRAPPGRAAGDRDADAGRDGLGREAPEGGPRFPLDHGGGRHLARRVARVGEPRGGAPAGRDLCRGEQPLGARNPLAGADGGAEVRAQGGRLRHPGRHGVRQRPGCGGRGLGVGGGAGARGEGPGAPRARDLPSRGACAPRRRPLSRHAGDEGLRDRGGGGALGEGGPDRALRGASPEGGLARRREGRGDRRHGGETGGGGGARGRDGAVAGAGRHGRPGLRGASRSRAGGGAVDSPPDVLRRGGASGAGGGDGA